MRVFNILLISILSSLLITGCKDGDKYYADIVRTDYGIPHIKANSWKNAGFGLGYAYAEDNFCVLMKAVVRANGQSVRFLGEEGSLADDIVFTYYNTDAVMQREGIESQPKHVRRLLRGYTAGLNRYLKDTGVENLAGGEEGCRDAEWVRELRVVDIVKVLHNKALRSSTQSLTPLIAGVEPPSSQSAQRVNPDAVRALSAISPQDIAANMGLPKDSQIGSNAYAIGANASQNNSGLLLGNPHFPWTGEDRFYMFHLDMGDKYNVMGAGLHGFPVVNVGFNNDIAWTHTVSTGSRFTLYELTLNPDNPFQYLYDDEYRDIEKVTVNVEMPGAGDGVVTRPYDLYLTHFGPVINLAGVDESLGGWPTPFGTLVVLKDANMMNFRTLSQWIEMGQANSMDAFKESLARLGLPWVNTIAASRGGDAFYGDISVIPNVSQQKLGSCVRGQLAMLLTEAAAPTLDGSDSECEWDSDEGAPRGVFGFESLPQLSTRDYVANANDSYWLSNPGQLLEGFSPLIGEERIAQALRTRQTFIQAQQRIAAADDLGAAGFNTGNMRTIMFDNRNLAAELVLDDLVAVCKAVTDWSLLTVNTAQAAQACDVLGQWDGFFNLESIGPHIFTEFWLRAEQLPDLWAVPFDAAAPLTTPNTLNTGTAGIAIVQALAAGIDALVAADIPMDRPWGQLQYSDRNGERIPIAGGRSSFMFSVTSSDLILGEGYTSIEDGNSYIQVVSWDDHCPDAYGNLTYSQSTDPASPHYADLTRLYSQNGWIDMPYCDEAIEAATISKKRVRE
ncbi:hypothetical protein FKG94_07975 [Exilibacterium tricleocarpae]|uniref:Acylase n=1 Tax=Exilibacterium tricleocarpae TaxID=2591008 RepID=A0A545TZL5_9GAMM|nr:penicillin acylase family protein [Exilibacterium tricleocarpae]TQV82656.1 hypothetical protein FKG94_07975 [Exilibacterium tricleocarpae]